MKLAIIKTGGKQYIATEGATLIVEKFGKDLKKGDTVTFDEVLLSDDGKSVNVGTPTVSGAKVSAEVVETGRAKKVVVFRYKAKSNRSKLKGHRQPFVKVKITSL